MRISSSGCIGCCGRSGRSTRRSARCYRERHLVECFIGKLKHFPHVFARFDKYARRYLAFVHLASTLIWLR